MIESEARKQWCPMARVFIAQDNVSAGPMNRASTRTGRGSTEESVNPPLCHCIASECAMWRWAHHEPIIEIFQANETNDQFVARRDRTLAERQGFCGLAGKPEHIPEPKW